LHIFYFFNYMYLCVLYIFIICLYFVFIFYIIKNIFLIPISEKRQYSFWRTSSTFSKSPFLQSRTTPYAFKFLVNFRYLSRFFKFTCSKLFLFSKIFRFFTYRTMNSFSSHEKLSYFNFFVHENSDRPKLIETTKDYKPFFDFYSFTYLHI